MQLKISPILNYEVFSLVGIKLTVLVFVYFALIAFYFLIVHEKRRKSVKGSIETLKGFCEFLNDNSGDLDIKNKLDAFFESKSETDHSETFKSLNLTWQEFSEGVIEYNSSWRNVYQAEEFFTEEILVQPALKKISHVPSLSSGFGLLFTFIALTAGLSELYYNETTKIIDHGLGDFINALSAKFITSIIGLGLALIIDSQQVRKYESELNHNLQNIVFELNKNFKRLTTQHMLLTLNKDVHEIPGEISKFFDSNSGNSTVLKNLEKSITEGVKNAVGDMKEEITKVATSMKDFSAAGLNGMSEQLTSIGKEMRQGLTEGLSQDLNSLKNTMEKLPEIISSTLQSMENSTSQMKIKIADSQKEMSELINKIFAEIQSRQGDNLNQLLNNLISKNNEITERLTNQQENMQRKHEESMELITRKLFENNESSSSQLMNLLEQMKNTFETSSSQFKDNLSSQHAQMQELTEKLLETFGQKTHGLTQNLEQSTRNLSEDYSRFQEQSKELQNGHISSLQTNYENSFNQLVDSQEQFKNHMEEMLSKNKSMFEPILIELKANVLELSKQTSTLPNELNKASINLNIAFEKIQGLLNNEIQEFIRTQNDLNSSQRKSLNELSDYLNRIAHLQNESKNLQNLMDKLVSMQEKIVDASERKDSDFKDQLEMLRVAMEQQRTLLDTHQASTSRLHLEYQNINELVYKLADNFGGVGDSLANSIIQIKDASYGYFDGFSKHHTEAVSQLKNLIDDMSSAISDSQFQVTK